MDNTDQTIVQSSVRSATGVTRVYSALADEIAAGARQAGERLPPERVMADQFGVSRGTLRQALSALAADGLIESHVGRGTFVAGGHLGEPPNVLMSFTELGRAHGLVASSVVLGTAVREATIDEGEEFGVAAGSSLFQLERLRFLDGQPIATDCTRVPLSFVPGVVGVDFTSASFYDTLGAHGCGPVRADYSVEAVIATDAVAELLGAPSGSAILVAHTRGYDQRGRLVEVGETKYRGDRYRFEATLRRRRRSWSGAAPHDGDAAAPTSET